MAMAYEVRSACLIGLKTEANMSGADFSRLLNDAGLDLESLEEHDRLINLGAVVKALALVSERTACLDIGMRVAQHQDLRSLGLLGSLIASEPDLASAFAAVQRYMALHNNAEHWRMQLHSGHAYIRRIEHFYGSFPSQQYREMALASYARFSMELGGGEARPLRVELSHSAIAPLKNYQHFFGCEVYFDQEYDCLVYDQKLMAYPVRSISGLTAGCTDEYTIQHLAGIQDSLELQVRSLITQTLGFHQHALDGIAALLGVRPRTLQRRLRSEGLSFQKLVLDVKMQLACWQLQASAIDITMLSDALGYSESAAFSKAFKKHVGIAPSLFRGKTAI